jgi:hypothetical protein
MWYPNWTATPAIPPTKASTPKADDTGFPTTLTLISAISFSIQHLPLHDGHPQLEPVNVNVGDPYIPSNLQDVLRILLLVARVAAKIESDRYQGKGTNGNLSDTKKFL